MGQSSKTAKGEISVSNYEGRIRLRWRYGGQRYSLNLPYPYSNENLHHATVKVAEIKLDILKGEFDTSLVKYKPKIEKEVAVLPLTKSYASAITDDIVVKFKIWAKQVRSIDLDTESSIDYYGVYRVLNKYRNLRLSAVGESLINEDWAVSTFNKRLNFLCGYFNWLVDKGDIVDNPLRLISKRREKKKKKNSRRIPLSEQEIQSFLDAIRDNTFCNKSSPVKHSFYYPFLRFVFTSGVRNAEAIGLKVKHIDLEKNQIEISEAFARTHKGTNHAQRISKGTKTGCVRFLPLSEALRELLLPLVSNREPECYVFPSPKKLSIDDRMLKRRVIKPVLLALGIGDRDLYAARHSFGTRAVQQGMVITDVAYLMGHSTVDTTIRNYVSVEKRNILLPTLKF